MADSSVVEIIKFIVSRCDDESLTPLKAVNLIRAAVGIEALIGVEDHKVGHGNPPHWPHPADVPSGLTVEQMELSTRPNCVLKGAGLVTARDVVEFGANRLLRLPNFGRKALREFGEVLNKRLNDGGGE